MICPVDKNCDHYTKNWLFAPNIQIFGSKKYIFAPSGQLEPHRSMFSTRKMCLIGFLIRGYQKLNSLPPKNWIFGQKTAKFGPKRAFSVKYWHFWPICSHTDQKTMRTNCPGGFSVMLVPKLLLTPIKIRIFGPKTAKYGPKYAFLVILGQIYSIWLEWIFLKKQFYIPLKQRQEKDVDSADTRMASMARTRPR